MNERNVADMSGKPYFSVVIPTYNRAKAVSAAIRSVLAQTYTNWELIVVDDGSTDDTRELLQQQYTEHHSFQYIGQVNQGQSAARNRGISLAKGGWIAFLDSDDVWLPDKLGWQARAIENLGNRCGACFTDANLLMSSGNVETAFRVAGRRYEDVFGMVVDEWKSLAKAFGGPWVQTLAARSDLVRTIGGFDTDQHFAEDHDFLFRLSLATPFCYVNLPLAEIDRTTNPNSAVVRIWEKTEIRLQAREYMYEKWLQRGSAIPEDGRRTIAHNLASIHSMWANWHLENGCYSAAQQSLSQAVRYCATPSLVTKWLLARLCPALARKITPKSQPYLGPL